jgi:hypothetical protein
MYIGDNPRKFEYQDQKEIDFVLSYMKTGLAGQWADNYVDMVRIRQQDEITYISTAEDFWIEMDKSFKDTQEVKEAQKKLATIKQGTLTAEEFFQKFESLYMLAGYHNGYDSVLINMLEQNMNYHLVHAIVVTQDGPPVKYKEWRDKAIRIDNLERSFRQSTRQSNYPQPPRPNYQPRNNDNRSSVPTSKPTTFSGRGQPMELGKVRSNDGCYRCGENGHIARDCTLPREVTCYYCKGQGHVTKACLKKKREQKKEGGSEKVRAAWSEMNQEERSAWIAEVTSSDNGPSVKGSD